MPALAPPVTGERDALRAFLAYHQSAFVAVSYGLTDEQARATPSVSALSIGGLVKHATGVQRSWMDRVAAAPGAPDDRPFEERAAEYQDWSRPPTSMPRCRYRGMRRGSPKTSTPGRCGG